MGFEDDARKIFDSLTEGIIYIDARGIVRYANTAYKKFLFKEKAVKPGQDVEGEPLKKFRPSTRLNAVLETGKSLLHTIRSENSYIYFANLYPVKENGVVTGAVGVLTFSAQAYDFSAELESYERRTKQIIRSANKVNTARYTFDSIIAAAPASLEVKKLAARIAKTDSTVLLQSESGTGKELYAQAIHNASPRANELFVAINCANFNAELLDSELFGYERGAFTGAAGEGKIGLFEAAHKGTLFLDEVSEMPLALQAKLLRVLQERRFRRVGAVREVDVDVRIIAACNANLTQYIKDGKFRKDLYYRLNVFCVRIPPLRERVAEIDALAGRILAEFSQTLKRPLSITGEAMDCLKRYTWPGNVRELRNVLESAGYLSESGIIGVDTLPNHISKAQEVPQQAARSQTAQPWQNDSAINSAQTLAEKLKLFERAEINKVLAKYGDDVPAKKKAAHELGISLATLYNKIS